MVELALQASASGLAAAEFILSLTKGPARREIASLPNALDVTAARDGQRIAPEP